MKQGLYKPLVMQFRFTNTLATFQRQINSVLGEHLDEFIMAYLNNIIIYLNSKEEHKKYIKWVLQRLYNKEILIAIKKYEFYITKTDFIGFIIKLGHINMDPKKIKAIVNWQDLENIIGLRLFLGFYNYYRKFIIKWLNKTEPFIRIIKKDKL